MWKLLVGFAVFVAIALFVLSKSGSAVDMGGEKHGVETTAEAASGASAPASAAALSASAPEAASAASAAASAASH